MVTPWVATHVDLALSGLSPEACRPDVRHLDGVNTSTGVFEVDGHGFTGGEPIRFSAQAGNTIPTGLIASTFYIVAATNGNPDFFTLSPLLIPSDGGVGEVGVTENILPKIDAIMAEWTSVLISSAIAYPGPWTVAPGWAPMLAAKLAAPTVASRLRVPSAKYDITMVKEGFAWAEDWRKRLRAGELFDDGVGPVAAIAPNVFNAAMGGQDRPPTCWRTGSL